MRKLFFLIAAWLCCFLYAGAEPAIPQVIPALQQWKSSQGKFMLPAEGQIVVAPQHEAELRLTAETFALDLKEMFGRIYTVATGKPKKGNIYLTLGKADQQLGDEGYQLDIRSYVTIEAPTDKGVFWGTRTLLQMLHNQPQGIQKGKAVDYPAYPVRGFMLDVGRKFFSMDYLKQYVKILSFYKINEFQIHLNDNGFVEFHNNDWNQTYSAFRLQSDKFPGLTAKDGSYSKEEFREFQQLAAQYGVMIIPEIDAPAHSLAFTHYNPRLAAEKKEYGMDHLDLYKPEVYAFLDTLYAEYCAGPNPVFVGPFVHIGTDEYNKKEVEQFRRFTQYYIDYIRGLGKTPRLWGSLKEMHGNTPVDTEGLYANAWNYGWLDVETALKEGYKVINTCDAYLYMVPAVNYYHDFLNVKWLYENWTPEVMDGGTVAPGNPNLLGGMFAVWNDRCGNGISEQDVHFRSFPAVQVLAEKLWRGVNPDVPFEAFEALCKQTPEAPGVNLCARVDGRKELTEPDQVLTFDGTETVATAVPEIGYPYAVEFEICPDSEPEADGTLFSGPHSRFVANWQNTGKFAFYRDGYEMVFHGYRLPAGEWTNVRIEGDVKGTSLFINGELKERLEGRSGQVYNYKRKQKSRSFYMETLIFPLQQIGDPLIGFKGKLKNLVCQPRQ